MNTEIFRRYSWLIILVLLVLAGGFFFLYRLYQNDIKVLADFVTSYQKFDTAMSDYSVSLSDTIGEKAGAVLTELTTKADFRISSLIKNDGELMNQAREIADLARKELDSLKVYKGASISKNVDVVGLVKAYRELTSRRKAAYAHFQELAGMKD